MFSLRVASRLRATSRYAALSPLLPAPCRRASMRGSVTVSRALSPPCVLAYFETIDAQNAVCVSFVTLYPPTGAALRTPRVKEDTASMSAFNTPPTPSTNPTRATKASRKRDETSAPDFAATSDAFPSDDLSAPTIQDVWRAQDVVRPHVYHTPLLHSRTLSTMTGATVYLKAENLQRAGSYKV